MTRKRRPSEFQDDAPFDIDTPLLQKMNKDAWRRTRRKPAAIALHILIVIVCCVAGTMIVHAFFRPAATWVTGLFVGLSTGIVMYALKGRARSHFRAIMRENGFEVCAACGYSLAQLGRQVRHCPECGAERVPLAPAIVKVGAETADAKAIMDALDADLRVRYPGFPIHGLLPGEETSPRLHFFLLKTEGQIAGCGALRLHADGTAEVKRMYVKPEFRRRGLSRTMLQRLEAEAARMGIKTLRLETGVGQPEALELYRSAGYTEIPKFGEYQNDPHSVCFEKRLR